MSLDRRFLDVVSPERTSTGVGAHDCVANVTTPTVSEIPDYVGSEQWAMLNRANREFNRQLIEYCRVSTSVGQVGFTLSNYGQVLAENASVELRLPDVGFCVCFTVYLLVQMRICK